MKLACTKGDGLPPNDEGHDAANIAAPRDQQNKHINFNRIGPFQQGAEPDRSVLHRALAHRLARLGLAHTSASDGGVLIGGMAYDLRTAIVMARQLGGGAA